MDLLIATHRRPRPWANSLTFPYPCAACPANACPAKEILGPDKAAAVAAAAAAVPSLSVLSVDKRRVKRKPPPPFITSTLQQEASRKLGLRVSQTMRTAQVCARFPLSSIRVFFVGVRGRLGNCSVPLVQDFFAHTFQLENKHRCVSIIGKNRAKKTLSAWWEKYSFVLSSWGVYTNWSWGRPDPSALHPPLNLQLNLEAAAHFIFCPRNDGFLS